MSTIRAATIAFALSRLGFGVGLIAAPARLASGWIGADAERPAVQIVLRGLGARDIAIAAGTLASLDDDDQLAGWLVATIAADLSDLAATLAAPSNKLPGNARWGTVALAGSAAALGAELLSAVKTR